MLLCALWFDVEKKKKRERSWKCIHMHDSFVCKEAAGQPDKQQQAEVVYPRITISSTC